MLTIYTLQESEKWDAIVRSFEEYDVYWLSGYVKGFWLHGDGEPMLIFYEEGKTRGINVIMKRDIARDAHFLGQIEEEVYFDVSTPYGYGGWLIEGDDREKLFHAYEDWCRKNGIISEFVRFHPVIDNYIVSEHDYKITALGQTVSMDISSPEKIWANLSSKNRNVIRKAEKSGVKIYNGRSKELYGQFREIYDATMKHDNAEPYYYFETDFYESICEDLAENAQVFYAKKDEEIIAASIIVAANGRLNYHLSGSKLNYRSLAPGNLLLYKAALWGSANGCKTFHLGGGIGSGEDNLFKFKRAFYRGDDLCRFYIGKKIYIRDKYEELIGMRGEIHSSYFPEYRA